jgi:hypothetical protein
MATSKDNDLAPLGAKPGSERTPREAKAIALLRSQKVKKESPGNKHLAPIGAKRQTMFRCTSRLNLS